MITKLPILIIAALALASEVSAQDDPIYLKCTADSNHPEPGFEWLHMIQNERLYDVLPDGAISHDNCAKTDRMKSIFCYLSNKEMVVDEEAPHYSDKHIILSYKTRIDRFTLIKSRTNSKTSQTKSDAPINEVLSQWTAQCEIVDKPGATRKF